MFVSSAIRPDTFTCAVLVPHVGGDSCGFSIMMDMLSDKRSTNRSLRTSDVPFRAGL